MNNKTYRCFLTENGIFSGRLVGERGRDSLNRWVGEVRQFAGDRQHKQKAAFAGACRCEDNNDLYACAGAGCETGEKSAGFDVRRKRDVL